MYWTMKVHFRGGGNVETRVSEENMLANIEAWKKEGLPQTLFVHGEESVHIIPRDSILLIEHRKSHAMA